MTDEATAIAGEAKGPAHNHGVYIADSTWRAVRLIAKDIERTTNWVVGRAVLEYVERNRKKQEGGKA